MTAASPEVTDSAVPVLTGGPRLLTLEEVAEISRLPVATLRWMRHNGTGPRAAKLGRRLVYKESDVLAWIEDAFERGQQVPA